MLYVALLSETGFVRLALPLDYLAQATTMLHGVLGGVMLLTILAALVASYALSNLTSRPLREIAASAARIGRSEQRVSIAVSTDDEVGDLPSASLINNILTLSQLESKGTSLNLNPLDISGTISKACMLVDEGAAQKNIVIINEVVEGLPKVMADQGRLEQVLVNLLENAVKYTPEGGSVRIFTEYDGALIKVSVADTGIGIPLKRPAAHL